MYVIQMSVQQSLNSNQLYYSIYNSLFGDTLIFLIGNNTVAIYGIYSYGFNDITGGLLRLIIFRKPILYEENKNIRIMSDEIACIEVKIGNLDYNKFMDVNFLINIYKKYNKNNNIKKGAITTIVIIENTLSTIDYKMSFVELIVSKKLIPQEEMIDLSTRLDIQELFNLYY